MPKFGPVTPLGENLHQQKYRLKDETFNDFVERFSITLAEDTNEYNTIKDIIGNQRFLPGGRVQLAVGNPHDVTAYNCFVGGRIEDSMGGIMDELKNSALTLRMGGGCGWDFSTIRPSGQNISKLGSPASGPVSMMGMWDSMCKTIMSQGLRRGAMMAVLRVDHPDILSFIHAKKDQHTLTNFNISVAITDEFMRALNEGRKYRLQFDGEYFHTSKNGDQVPYGELDAEQVWDLIMDNNWDWAEPGVLFIDRINRMHPLGYCETIGATNPCGEQPLTYNDGCLLGSFNMVKYIYDGGIDYEQLTLDVMHATRFMNRVIDVSNFALPQQKETIMKRRRIGMGVTGMANALEMLGMPYASDRYIHHQELLLEVIRDTAYLESAHLAKELGSFELFNYDQWSETGFAKTLPDHIREVVKEYGLRNSLLLSIAPTGTISICADNISPGIEPPFMLEGKRKIKVLRDGVEVMEDAEVIDWLYRTQGIKGRTSDEISAEEHIKVLCSAQKYMDSSVSKTCNVGSKTTKTEFKNIYLGAWSGGAKGCTTFRKDGKRFGIMQSNTDKKDNVVSIERKLKPEQAGAACTFDPATGVRTCDG